MKLHIERVVVEGLALSRADAAALQAAITAELGRLMQGAVLRGEWQRGASLASLKLDALAPANAPKPLGAQVARSLHRGLTGGG